MPQVSLTDDHLIALFFYRLSELESQYQANKLWYRRLTREGVNFLYANRLLRDFRLHPITLTKLTVRGRDLIKAIIEHEEADKTDGVEKGVSSLLHGEVLFTWSHSTAVRAIEDMRGVRQRNEERKAQRTGRVGCHETRKRAEPRPNMVICTDDCRHGADV